MKNKFIMAAALVFLSNNVFASPILGPTTSGTTCGLDDGRAATLTGAAQCAFTPTIVTPVYDNNGTMRAVDIAYFYGETWESAGGLTGDGTSNYLSATSDEGWGNIPNSGDWAITAAFWEKYSKGVITMHIGSGGYSPDNWAWLLTNGVLGGLTSDTADDGWSLSIINADATGGGLSNLKLWGVLKDPTDVPAPGILGLLSISVLAMVGIRRRKKA